MRARSVSVNKTKILIKIIGRDARKINAATGSNSTTNANNNNNCVVNGQLKYPGHQAAIVHTIHEKEKLYSYLDIIIICVC